MKAFTKDQDHKLANFLNSHEVDPSINTLDKLRLKLQGEGDLRMSVDTRIVGRLKDGVGNTACEVYAYDGAVAYYFVGNDAEYWRPGKDPIR
jgi:hypothetical protein